MVLPYILPFPPQNIYHSIQPGSSHVSTSTPHKTQLLCNLFLLYIHKIAILDMYYLNFIRHFLNCNQHQYYTTTTQYLLKIYSSIYIFNLYIQHKYSQQLPSKYAHNFNFIFVYFLQSPKF